MVEPGIYLQSEGLSDYAGWVARGLQYASDPGPPHDRGGVLILAIGLALLPVAFVVALTTHDLQPWRRTLKHFARFPSGMNWSLEG